MARPSVLERIKSALRNKTPTRKTFDERECRRKTAPCIELPPRGASTTARCHDQDAHLEQLKFVVLAPGSPGFSLWRRFNAALSGFEWHVRSVNSRVAWIDQGLRPGDVLESIAGVQVTDLEEDEVLALLCAAAPSSVLRFRVDCAFDQCRVTRFQVVVHGDTLGVMARGDGVEPLAVVDNVSRAAARGGRAVERGDVLVDVSGTSVVGLAMTRIQALIQKTPSPKILTFQRWSHAKCSAQCTRGYDTLAVAQAKASYLRADVVLVWRYGPLGMTLSQDPKTSMPVVNRLTGKGTAVGLERIHHGHRLASINGEEVAHHPFKMVCRMLVEAKKPVRLAFKAPLVVDENGGDADNALMDDTTTIGDLEASSILLSPRWSSSSEGIARVCDVGREERPYYYDVEWTRGHLGLRFCSRPSQVRGGRVVSVQSLKPGVAMESKLVNQEDQLVALNGRPIPSTMRLSDIAQVLTSIPKPVVLTFARNHPSSNMREQDNNEWD